MEFRMFSLLRGHFPKSCKSGEFNGGGGYNVQLVDNTQDM